MGITTNPDDPRLGHGVDNPSVKVSQHDVYLVLSEEERAKGFVRPLRRSYIHLKCNTVTSMGDAIAETYARNPHFYGATYCVACQGHYRVGEDGEFIWLDGGQKVGT